ncbi:Phage terminase, large subunit [Labilithrix luteola]|uniref:Phage terminase, large subunit n=1 Tax=Labilithrix luteola TaxID=1391654 RepID=A0A0K1PJ10_9BACT|nr:terminase family protein [Labilithrix luteola]AKU93381.1 Phage terminase, large subunit [Labilithrix luteola]
MTPAEEATLLAQLEALEAEEKRRDRYSEWCPHKPTVKQQEFLDSTELEVLFGGAAGGGKSDALLMAALQYVDQPGYAALILRRTYADLALPGAIMARSHEWLQGTRAKWSEKEKTWTFPSGATLTFGFLDNAQDRFRYQGSELQFVGFDETTQFPEAWYRYLLSRLRRPRGSKIPLRARGATNPGGLGHAWVFNRFVKSKNPQCRFIPSKLADNPHLDVEEYRRSLSLLDEATRRQLEEGIWIQDASGLVYAKARRLQTMPGGEWAYLLGIDFGIKDATAYVVLGWRKNDRAVYIVESFKEVGTTVTQAAQRVLAYQRQYSFSQVIGDLGGMGKAFGQEFTRRYSIPIEPAQKQNKRGYIGLLNGAIERGELVILEPTNAALIKELDELPWSDDSHLKEADGFDNHLTDALLYAWRATTAFSQTVPEPETEDPLDEIRKQVAKVWKRHEEETARAAARARFDDYDIGARFDPEEY